SYPYQVLVIAYFLWYAFPATIPTFIIVVGAVYLLAPAVVHPELYQALECQVRYLEDVIFAISVRAERCWYEQLVTHIQVYFQCIAGTAAIGTDTGHGIHGRLQWGSYRVRGVRVVQRGYRIPGVQTGTVGQQLYAGAIFHQGIITQY